MLSDVSQKKRDKCGLISHMWGIKRHSSGITNNQKLFLKCSSSWLRDLERGMQEKVKMEMSLRGQ